VDFWYAKREHPKRATPSRPQPRRAVAIDHLQQLRKDFRVAGDQVAGLQVGFVAGKVADQAAGLGDQQRAAGDVPGRQAELPEAVEASAGDVGQVECGGTRAADAGLFFASSLKIAR
jgi:hypothetical protein